MATRAKPDGRHRPRIKVNVVYRTIQATGGPTATARRLGVSVSQLAVWRRRGQLTDARTVLKWGELLHPTDPAAAYQLARRLAGLAPYKDGR